MDRDQEHHNETLHPDDDLTPPNQIMLDTSQSLDSYKDYERGLWGRKLEFLLSVIGYSVGVGNLWRFPYLVMQNGGGAFLIPFLFFMVLCGFPLFYLEMALGQFSGTSCLFVWRFCPLFKGVGLLMVMASFLYCWYYIMVMVWVSIYFFNSFRSKLPWSRCGQSWNTGACISGIHAINACNVTDTSLCDTNMTLLGIRTVNMVSTASKEFWHNYVLERSSGLEDFGTVRWHLVLALVISWFVVFLCQMKGVKSVGKVVYVTAVLPYILLTVLLIRGLTLPGAMNGIKYYITPDFSRLTDGQVWLQAIVQVFFSLGPAWGALVTMSSYNKFNNNCLRDAFICCMADGLTSIYAGFVIFTVIGYVAHSANVDITEVATSGPGLALVIYPEAIAQLPIPQLWAALFFIMLIFLAIDSQFGMFETLSNSVTDMFPKLRHHKSKVCACLCICIMLIDIPFTTNGGIYLSQLVDWYFGSYVVLIISILECILIAWVYELSMNRLNKIGPIISLFVVFSVFPIGTERFSADICLMTGNTPHFLVKLCWSFITPLILIVTFLIMIIQYKPPVYDGYTYSFGAEVFGNILAVIPIIPLPVTIIYQIYKTEGKIMERIKFLLKPAADWGPRVSKYREEYTMNHANNEGTFVDIVKNNLHIHQNV